MRPTDQKRGSLWLAGLRQARLAGGDGLLLAGLVAGVAAGCNVFYALHGGLIGVAAGAALTIYLAAVGRWASRLVSGK